MSDSADNVVTIGVAAWARIRDHGRKNFDDWLCVGRALQIGRTAALKAASCNRPVGSKYNREMGRWLVDHQMDGISASERYAILKIIAHLDAVESWRNSLPDSERRRHNHPSLWNTFRRATKAETGTPARRCVKGEKSSHRPSKPVYFGQDMIGRAAMALRECGSPDIFRLARVALEAAIRSEADLVELLDPHAVAMSALPQRTDVVSAAGHVG
jgi:hypothetical protein